MNFIRNIQRIMTSVLLGTLIVVCICSCGDNTSTYVELASEASENLEPVDTESAEDENATERESEEMVCIYVCGAVNSPGVYTLPAGSRICDAFAAAGGFTEEAAIDYWNQAKLLKDGDMIYVPTIEEASQREFSLQEDADDGKVNINTATEEELMTLPGIGVSKAKAIIAYRENEGLFSNVEDIKQVEGIKDGVYEKIKDYIVIN